MATIKTYESQVLPTKEAASAYASPALATQGPETARAGMGKEVANLGFEWQKQIANAQAASEFAVGMANFQREVHDRYSKITSSPEFKANPEGSMASWNEELPKIQQSISSQLRSDHARQLFNNQATGHAATYTNQFSDQVRKTQVGNVAASMDMAISTASNLAAAAPNQDTLIDHVSHGLAAIDAKYHAGVYSSAEAYVKDRASFIETVLHSRADRESWENPEELLRKLDDPKSEYARITKDDREVWPGLSERVRTVVKRQADKTSRAWIHENRAQEKWIKQQQEPIIFQNADEKISKIYNLNSPGGDPDKFDRAWEDLQVVETQKSLNLTPKLAHALSNIIRARKKEAEQKVAEARGADSEDFRQGVIDGTIPADKLSSFVGSRTKERPDTKDQDWALKHLNIGKEQKEKTDLSVKANIRERILDTDRPDHITDRKPIDELRGHGLSDHDADQMVRLQKTLQDPSKSNEYKLAIQTYDKAHEDDWKNAYGSEDVLEISARRNSFIHGLNEAVAKENLSGQAILDKANDLLKQEMLRPEGGVRKSIPKPLGAKDKSSKIQQQTQEPTVPKFLGLDRNTGSPVYELPDGSRMADTTRKPKFMGTHKQTGDPIYEAPDGTLFIGPVPGQQTQPPESKSRELPELEEEEPKTPEEIEEELEDEKLQESESEEEVNPLSAIRPIADGILDALLGTSEAQAGEIPGAKVGNLLGYDASGRAIYDAWEATGELSKEKDSDKWTLKPPEDELDEEGRDHNQFRARLNDVLADPEQRAELFRRVLMGDIGIDWDISPEEMMKDINRSEKEGHGLNEELWNKIVEHIKPSDALAKEQGND